MAFNFTEEHLTYPTVENESYNEGSHVNITCGATGKPAPEVRWAHNGHEQTFRLLTAYLIFCKIEKRDAGIYTYFANNSVGQKEKQLKLLVNCTYDSVTINHEATANSIYCTTTLPRANTPTGHY